MEPACSGALVVSGGGDGASIERRRPWRRKLPPLPRASPSRADSCAFLPAALLGSSRQGEGGSHAGKLHAAWEGRIGGYGAGERRDREKGPHGKDAEGGRRDADWDGEGSTIKRLLDADFKGIYPFLPI